MTYSQSCGKGGPARPVYEAKVAGGNDQRCPFVTAPPVHQP